MENLFFIKDKEKYAQDLERYEIIINYFRDNPSRILFGKNIGYLDNICDSLNKSFPTNIDISDKNIQEKITAVCKDRESNEIYSKSRELVNKFNIITYNSVLEKITKTKNLREKLKNIEVSKGSLIDQWIGELM